jgi:hypothetical protein
MRKHVQAEGTTCAKALEQGQAQCVGRAEEACVPGAEGVRGQREEERQGGGRMGHSGAVCCTEESRPCLLVP